MDTQETTAPPLTTTPGCVPLSAIQHRAIRLAARLAVLEARTALGLRLQQPGTIPLAALRDDAYPQAHSATQALQRELASIPLGSAFVAAAAAVIALVAEMSLNDVDGLAQLRAAAPPAPDSDQEAEPR